MKYNIDEFYPTPEPLLEAMTDGINWKEIETVLEPSAGKGNIAEFCIRKRKEAAWNTDLDIDCIELDSELKSVLNGKGLRVVHDDFLTFQTYKRYDLIIMNPPFSQGAKHLLHALELMLPGTGLICVLNAETIKNPYTNERRELAQCLEDLGAEIQYIEGAFLAAERKTDVKVAIVKAYMPEGKRESFIYEGLKRKSYMEQEAKDMDALAPNDFVDAAVQMYNLETEAGLKLIREYRAMVPHIMSDVRKDLYPSPILEMKIAGRGELSENEFVRRVRMKYWRVLFNNRKITGKMTSAQQQEYNNRVEKLADYDFSHYNIRTLQEEMSRTLVRGIEDCIIGLFDKLSAQYSYYDETSKNIHYYNGWKTNKAWIINKRVILPGMCAFSSYSGRFEPSWRCKSELADIEKALNYLDGGLTDSVPLEAALSEAELFNQTRKIELKYFYVTFYKKGTCHIEFKDMELLKKLNIFGSQQKKWLPPSYGKCAYGDMPEEERVIVEAFEGKEEYQKTLKNAEYFIYNPQHSVKAIENESDEGV